MHTKENWFFFLHRGVVITISARPAVESRHSWLYVLLLFLFLTIPVRPIISKSTGPIFAKFSVSGELRSIWHLGFFRSKNVAMTTNGFILVLSKELDAGRWWFSWAGKRSAWP